MKRIYICIGIFVLIVSASIFSLNSLSKNNKKLSDSIDEIVALYESDSPLTEQKVEEFEQFWNKYYENMSYAVNTCKLDEMSQSVIKLAPLLRYNSDSFVAECESVKQWGKLIYSRQVPNFYTLF